MTTSTQQRHATPEERAELESIRSRTSRQYLKEEVLLAFSPWASLVLLFVVAWVLAAWLGRKLFALNFGWNSESAPAIFGVGVLLCTLAMVPHLVKATRSRNRSLSKVLSDLADGVVEEEQFHFVEVKRFLEPEHGGLMYFFRTLDDRVFTLFDSGSQDLGVDGQDPLSSSFEPRTKLVTVRAPASRRVLRKTFSGELLPLPAPLELTARPEDWPDAEEYCKTAWARLDAKLGKGGSRFSGDQ